MISKRELNAEVILNVKEYFLKKNTENNEFQNHKKKILKAIIVNLVNFFNSILKDNLWKYPRQI